MSDNNYNNPYGNNSNNPYRNSRSTDNTPDKNNFTYDNRFYSAEHEHNGKTTLRLSGQTEPKGRQRTKRVFGASHRSSNFVGTIGTLSYFYQIVPEKVIRTRLERVDEIVGPQLCRILQDKCRATKPELSAM